MSRRKSIDEDPFPNIHDIQAQQHHERRVKLARGRNEAREYRAWLASPTGHTTVKSVLPAWLNPRTRSGGTDDAGDDVDNNPTDKD